MNTNREVVISLIELLVKKAGFDLNKNQAEEELIKTKENIKKLNKEKDTSSNKKNISKLIENLKVREAFWENNAEIVGRSLIDAYDDGKNYASVKMRIELLSNLASKGTKNLEVGYLYNKINELEKELETLEDKVQTTDYSNYEEKEMDLKYKVYLENKITSADDEIVELEKELDNLRDVEIKDVAIVNKIKDYNDNLSNNLKRLQEASQNSMNTDIALDIFKRLELARSDMESKLEKSKDALNKTTEMLDDVRKNRTNLNNRKTNLEEDRKRCALKLNILNEKLEEDKYINVADQMMDLSNIEMAKAEMESLINKRDVIYVDAIKVKEELIKAWDAISGSDRIKNKKKKESEEVVIREETKDIKPEVEESIEVNEETEVELPKGESREYELESSIEDTYDEETENTQEINTSMYDEPEEKTKENTNIENEENALEKYNKENKYELEW